MRHQSDSRLRAMSKRKISVAAGHELANALYGSATGGTTAGGAAISPTVRDLADPVIIHTSKARGAVLTPSYEEGKAALLLALDWARAN